MLDSLKRSKILNNGNRRSTLRLSVAVFFALTITIAMLASIPAFAKVPTNYPTTCWLSLRPNPIGLGQELLINGWRSPPPHQYEVLGITPPPGEGAANGVPFDMRLIITKPDGHQLDLYPIRTDGPGTFWLSYVVDQLGTWTFELIWEGDEWFQPSSVTQTLVVQNEQIPSWPEAPLPTDGWTYPVNYENREWASIMGGWFMPKYDETASNYNPYTQAPRSSHVLYKVAPVSGIAGLIGGQYGTANYYTKSSLTFSVVMAGRAYASSGGNIYCYDIRTGEQLWVAPGSFNVGSIRSGTPSLYALGNRFIVYNGLTGAVTLNVTGMAPVATGMQGVGYSFDDPYVYSRQTTGPGGPRFFIKWTTAGNTANFTERIIWNVTWPEYLNEPPMNDSWQGLEAWGDNMMFQFNWPFYGQLAGFNLTNGEVMWHYYMDTPWLTSRGGNGYAYGLVYCPIHAGQLAAWNMTTGELVWKSETVADPWGGFWGYQHCAAYGLIYKLTYAGVYAFNATNGKIVWYFATEDVGLETPYAIQAPGETGLEEPKTVMPFFNIAVVGDGVLFAPTGEHTPTTPYLRGQRLYAIDAHTGKEIWSIMGYWSNVNALAEGTLFTTNTYDGCAYAFAKGKTATTVEVSSDVAAKGSSILIKGTVMDMSPAQPNTPAVSDDSMTAWMEYLHMQQPKPTNTTGVPVKLTAVDQAGQVTDIGTVWTDANGYFKKLWTPTVEGEYAIIATFDGSLSYYSSSAETVVGVGPAAAGSSPSVTEPPTSPSTTDSPAPTTTSASPTDSTIPTSSPSAIPGPESTTGTEVYIAIAAAVIIVAVIAVALVLRRRSK
jgi:outer membrane protein assembly factor BamB